MKVAINRCYGGFSLSRKAVARMAELQGRPCYFFTYARKRDGGLDTARWAPAPEPKEGECDLFWQAFDVPNPNEVLKRGDWSELTQAQREAENALYATHAIECRYDDRSEPTLIQVIRELGKEANGGCADLEIIEIPDGTDYTIEEYDGIEHIAEAHRTWP
jgi:hypothetical protein